MVGAPGQDSASGPKWSPDGSRVAFVAGDILVVSLADGAIANLTNHLGGSSPAWSRDGGKIAFTSTRDGLTELYVMNADGSSVRRLTDHIGFNGRPAWSPDSSRIAFGCELEIGNQDICTINADGSGLVRLTTDPARDYGAVFSSGGTRVRHGAVWTRDDCRPGRRGNGSRRQRGHGSRLVARRHSDRVHQRRRCLRGRCCGRKCGQPDQ